MAYEDLLKDTSAVAPDDNSKFIITILDLNLSTLYPIQFRWKYKDGTFGKWSVSKILSTPGESFPDTPKFSQTDVEGGPEYIKVTWGGLNTSGNPFTNYDRVDVYISGSPFDGSKPAASFKEPGTQILKAPQGEYLVALYAVSVAGTRSAVSADFSVIVTAQGETVEPPTNPNGFSIDRVLGGILVNWAGTYANGTFTGFEAIKIYVGTSATATAGTYKEAGVLTGNNVKNTITIPVDGTYVRYNLPVYVHAAAVNKNAVVGTLQQNVASDLLGARSAISSDLADEIITNAKLVADSVTATKIALGAITEVKIDTGAITAAKIAAGAVTETKIADNAISSPKIVAGAIDAGKIAAGAITADKIQANAISADKIQANAISADKIVANSITAGKIDALAITSEKIAADAITATKIKAGEIDVLKLAAGTISVNNLEAGTITSTSYIRAGSKNISTGLGARVEISSAAIEDGTVDIAAGLFIYNSTGTAVFKAPLSGGLEIVGGGTFTGDLSVGSGSSKFGSDSNGIWLGSETYSANSTFRVSRSGYMTANSGTVGGWSLTSSYMQNGTGTFKISSADSTVYVGDSASTHIRISASGGIATYNAGNPTSPTSGFSLSTSGVLNISGGVVSGGSITGTTITGSTIQSLTDSYFGYVRLNSPTMEIVGASGTVYGQLYQFNEGSELILRHGSSREAGGYPTSSAYLSLNSNTISLGYTNSVGGLTKGILVSTTGSHISYGNMSGIGNGTVALGEFRNIAAGSGVQSTTTSTNGNGNTAYIGDIYIQY